MSDPTMKETLRKLEFFQDISEEDLALLAEIARPVEFPANSVMFRELEPARDVYVIISGRVSLVIFEPGLGGRQLMEAGAGDFVGWSPLVGRARLSDTAHTLTSVQAVALDSERALALCSVDPQFGCKFMQRVAQVLAQRLAATRSLLVEKCGSELPEFQIESD